MARRSWNHEELKIAVKKSKSIRAVILKLGLIPAGGNYSAISRTIKELFLDISHFTFKGWRKGTKIPILAEIPLETILVSNSSFQSHKLKIRLFKAGLKQKKCEECDWAKQAPDGRLPLELDHINGNSRDNRLENLRVLCPNCHSLKPMHRGMNRKLG